MSRKLNSGSLGLACLVLITAATAALAQTRLEVRSVAVQVPARPTLGCCKCLGGTNSLDLSTIPSNGWTVNGNAVSFLTTLNALWNINPGPAKWVSTLATGSAGSVPAGTYDYKLDFVVPACTIDQKITLTGNYGGDDDVAVILDSGSPISTCVGGWCFNTPNKPLSTFSTSIGPGGHTLTVKVKNDSPSPSGMFVNAKLTGTCTGELTKR